MFGIQSVIFETLCVLHKITHGNKVIDIHVHYIFCAQTVLYMVWAKPHLFQLRDIQMSGQAARQSGDCIFIRIFSLRGSKSHAGVYILLVR